MQPILAEHNEFGSLVGTARRVSNDSYYSYNAITTRDWYGMECSGEHGTHVAGVAAGLTYGPAKEATIVSGEQSTTVMCSHR